MNKRIIFSLSTLIVTGAVLVGGTGAFFSDTETSAGNVFTAGDIDLKINHTAQTYNGVDCQTCGVSISSSANTQVIGSNAAAAYQAPFPVNAQLIANPNSNWVNESTVAPAEWIWVTPIVAPGDLTNSAEYTFEETFFLQGPIDLTTFNLSLAADNGYKLVVNGVTIVDKLAVVRNFNTLNPLTSAEQSAFEAALNPNSQNSIQITVRNTAVAGSNQNSNPAGLIYKIVFTNQDCAAGVADFQQKCELWATKDLTTETFFDFSDIKPQDSGTNLISLNVTSNDAFACMNVVNKVDDENTINNPEANSGDTTAAGEMGSFLTVRGFYSDAAGVIGDVLFPATLAKDLGTIAYADSVTNTFIPGNTTEYVKLEWCIGNFNTNGTCDGNIPNINQTQTDQFIADLQFSAIQKRNNAEYECPAV